MLDLLVLRQFAIRLTPKPRRIFWKECFFPFDLPLLSPKRGVADSRYGDCAEACVSQESGESMLPIGLRQSDIDTCAQRAALRLGRTGTRCLWHPRVVVPHHLLSCLLGCLRREVAYWRPSLQPPCQGPGRGCHRREW